MKQHVLTQDNFDRLLEWLDPDREKAGEKYEAIRSGLITLFEYKGCLGAEDLADETINRVARRVKEISDTYSGEPARYFYGVGKRVHMEYLKQKPSAEILPEILAAPQQEDVEQQYACLDECIGHLTASNRTLILQYYRERKQAKIDSRRSLLRVMNLKPSALRVRVFRIRETLEKCVRRCLELEG
jgi:DNA-directed RNA polymerase specialized sigma24 family protein